MGDKSAWVRFRAVLLGGMLAVTEVGHAVHVAPESPHAASRALCDSPREAVKIFLKAVGRSELALFDHVIDRSQIKPERVEYVYGIGGSLPTVTIYSALKEPIDIPGNPEVEIRAVSSVLGQSGSIVETTAHAFARQGVDR